MEVFIEPTREDLLAYNLFYLQYSKEARKQMRKARIARSVIIVLFAGFFIICLRTAGVLVSLYSSLLAFALLSAFYVILSLWSESRNLKKRVQRLTDEGNLRAALSPRTYKLTEDAVTFDGELTGGWIKWEAIDDIQETQEHVFILLSARMAYIIPKGAFTTPIDAQQFVEAARRFKAESGPMGRGASVYRKEHGAGKGTASEPLPADAAFAQNIPHGERSSGQKKDDSAFDGWS